MFLLKEMKIGKHNQITVGRFNVIFIQKFIKFLVKFIKSIKIHSYSFIVAKMINLHYVFLLHYGITI